MAGVMPFGLKIAIISRAFRKKMDEKASTMGLTYVQLRVLGSVSRLEEFGESEVHQNDLEQIEHVTHPAMTKLLQKLESKGFIKCVPSSKDRRYKKITCTERSSGIHKMILSQDKEVFDDLCGNFTEDQKQTLLQMIGILLKNIDSKNF